MSLYPLKFKPLLRSKIWGGKGIFAYKDLPVSESEVGESWEIADMDGAHSVVENGEFEGVLLHELIERFGEELVGKHNLERYKSVFPLLIKFIDAESDLSIQVHPDDDTALKRHGSFGKSEMWYVMHAEEGAYLYLGFSKRITPEEYERRVAENTLTEVLQKFYPKAGDVYYIPAGRVHNIGKGLFVAEIQQNSDITYRIYDYGRLGDDGKPRELHIEEAKDVIDFTPGADYMSNYEVLPNIPNRLIVCRYFSVNMLYLTTPVFRAMKRFDSFVLYLCLEGQVTLTDDSENSVLLHTSEIVLVPAQSADIRLEPSFNARLLEIYVGE